MTDQRQFRVHTDPPRPITQMLSVRDDEQSPTGLVAQYRGRWHVLRGTAGQLVLGDVIKTKEDDEDE